MRSSLIAVLPFALMAAEPRERPPVTVGTFDIEPMANFTYRDDTVGLHPKALFGIGYNSNVIASDNPRADEFTRAIVGCDLDWALTGTSWLKLDAEIENQNYLDEDAFDVTGGRGGLAYERRGMSWEYGTSLRAARIDDPEPRTGEQLERETIDGRADIARQGRWWRIGFGALFQSEDYLQDSAVIDADQRDYSRYGGSVFVGRVTARDTEFYDRTVYRRTEYADSSLYQNSDGIMSLLGWRFRSSVRTRMVVEGGVDYRRYDGRLSSNPDADTSVLEPAGNILFIYPWEEGSQVRARASAEIVDGLRANAARAYSAGLDGRYRLLQKMHLIGGTSVYRVIENDAPPGSTSERRTTLRFEAGLQYFMRDGVGVRWLNSYAVSDSTLLNDYERYVSVVEMAVAF